MLTMLLGGLWHGAAWSFLLWGGLHGAYLIVHRAWAGTALRTRMAERGGMAWRLAGIVVTFHAVCFAWVFFRLPVFGEALTCVAKLVRFDADKAWVGGAAEASVWAALAGYGLLMAIPRVVGEGRPLARGFAWGYGLAVVALAILLAPGGGAPAFIYFQF
jgi:D-alanyl-lipoteichoic acid acyltransferase DltB (MBOAT superfamily)